VLIRITSREGAAALAEAISYRTVLFPQSKCDLAYVE